MRKLTAVHPSQRDDPLLARFAAIRSTMKVTPDFPADVVAEAEHAATAAATALPDQTDVPFITLDPPGSLDLDQAMCLERRGAGYRVRYAIADVPVFVTPGGALDLEARRRGVTIYCPDMRVPLHPPVLSEGAASLLPDQVRPAFVWDMTLDADGTLTSVAVTRALVRSRERRDYRTVQAQVDAGAGDEATVLLREIGERRIALERARGGASLPMPEQQVDHDGARYIVTDRPLSASEDWNAQISLMTGMAAAAMMIDGRIGILRTMPAPDEHAIARFRAQAAALGAVWEPGLGYGDFIRTLDYRTATHLALIHEAATLFRGAAYTAFAGEAPADARHAAVAAPYAHVTAPLRRLVDRFGLVVCEAVANGRAVPEWARAALPQLPEIMAGADRTAGAVERACIDAVEAAVLAGDIGRTFPAVVIDQTDRGVPVVQIATPAIVARAAGQARPGQTVTVRVDAADITSGGVTLTLVER